MLETCEKTSDYLVDSLKNVAEFWGVTVKSWRSACHEGA
jgi:hypothetical protein